jgi:hypothetical protein
MISAYFADLQTCLILFNRIAYKRNIKEMGIAENIARSVGGLHEHKNEKAFVAFVGYSLYTFDCGHRRAGSRPLEI